MANTRRVPDHVVGFIKSVSPTGPQQFKNVTRSGTNGEDVEIQFNSDSEAKNYSTAYFKHIDQTPSRYTVQLSGDKLIVKRNHLSTFMNAHGYQPQLLSELKGLNSDWRTLLDHQKNTNNITTNMQLTGSDMDYLGFTFPDPTKAQSFATKLLNAGVPANTFGVANNVLTMRKDFPIQVLKNILTQEMNQSLGVTPPPLQPTYTNPTTTAIPTGKKQTISPPPIQPVPMQPSTLTNPHSTVSPSPSTVASPGMKLYFLTPYKDNDIIKQYHYDPNQPHVLQAYGSGGQKYAYPTELTFPSEKEAGAFLRAMNFNDRREVYQKGDKIYLSANPAINMQRVMDAFTAMQHILNPPAVNIDVKKTQDLIGKWTRNFAPSSDATFKNVVLNVKSETKRVDTNRVGEFGAQITFANSREARAFSDLLNQHLEPTANKPIANKTTFYQENEKLFIAKDKLADMQKVLLGLENGSIKLQERIKPQGPSYNTKAPISPSPSQPAYFRKKP